MFKIKFWETEDDRDTGSAEIYGTSNNKIQELKSLVSTLKREKEIRIEAKTEGVNALSAFISSITKEDMVKLLFCSQTSMKNFQEGIVTDGEFKEVFSSIEFDSDCRLLEHLFRLEDRAFVSKENRRVRMTDDDRYSLTSPSYSTANHDLFSLYIRGLEDVGIKAQLYSGSTTEVTYILS